MTTDALSPLPLGRFERRLRLGLILTFVGIAALLLWLGIWLERPFRALPVEPPGAGRIAPGGAEGALSTEVAR